MAARHFALRAGRSSKSEALSNMASGLIAVALIIPFLYLGRAILEPLVIAALLAFVLSPLIRRLRSFGLWRFLTVVLAIGVIAALGSIIAVQTTQSLEDWKRYPIVCGGHFCLLWAPSVSFFFCSSFCK